MTQASNQQNALTTTTTTTTRQPVLGHAVYSRPMLLVYDFLVLGLGNRFVTRCPSKAILGMYDDNVSDRHLEVGVGTGYFPDRCRFPSASPRIALCDINPNSLRITSERLARYRPECFQRDVLQPLDLDGARFKSIGCNYLLHCLPGAIPEKAVVFDRLHDLLEPGGVLFGSTILRIGSDASFLSKMVIDLYNLLGIFANGKDSLADLEGALRGRFADVSITVRGSAAMFRARRTR